MDAGWRRLNGLGAMLMAAALAFGATAKVVVLHPPTPPAAPPAQNQPPGAGLAPTGPAADEARRLNEQGLALVQQKQFDAAEAPLTQAMALCDGALRGEHFCVAGVSMNLALIAEGRGDLPAAERFLTRAAEVTRAAMGLQDPQFGDIAVKLSRIMVMEGRYRQAEPWTEVGLAIRARIGDARSTQVAVLNLAQIYRATQRLAQAETLLRQLLPICAKADPTCEPTTRARLGETLWGLDRRPEAEAELRKGAALYGALGLAEPQEAALLALAKCFTDASLWEKAEPLLKAQVEAAATGRAERPANVAANQAELARLYAATGRVALAEPLLKSAQALLAAGGMTSTETGAVTTKIGGALLEANRVPEGRMLLERAMALPMPPQALPPWWRVEAEAALGDVAQSQLRLADAEALFRKAADDYAAIANPGMSRLRRNHLAVALIAQRRVAEGEAILKGLLTEIQAQQPVDPKGVAMIEGNLAMAANDRRDFKAAEALATDALAKQAPAGEAPGRDAAGLLDALGKAEMGLGKYAEAEGHMLASLKFTEARTVRHTGVLANIRAGLCDLYASQSRQEEEQVCARDLAGLIASWPEAGPGWRLQSLITLGNADYSAGLYPRARDAFLAATQIETSELRAAATANMNLGQVYVATGEYDKALTSMTRSRALFVQAGAQDEDAGVESGRRLGDLQIALGRYKEAEPLIRASLTWFETHLGPGHPRTALQVRSLARLMMDWGRPAEAEPLFARALAIRQAAPSPNPTLIAQSLSDLARCEMALGRYDKAREDLRRSDLAEAQAKGAAHWYLGVAARELGDLDAAQARLADAEANYRRAGPLLAGGGEAARVDTEQLEIALARLDIFQGRMAAAEQRLQHVVTTREKTWGIDSVYLVDPLGVLAAIDQGAGRYPKAQAGLTRILAIERRAYGEGSPQLAYWWMRLAQLFQRTGRGAQADQALGSALSIQRNTLGLESPAALGVLIDAATLHAERGKLGEAKDEADRAVTLARAAKSPVQTIWALEAVGDIARRQSRLPEAEAALTEAVDQSRALWGEGNVAMTAALTMLGSLEIDAGRPQKAEMLFTQAAAVARNALPADHLLHVYLTNDLALAYLAQGQAAKAETLLKPVLGRLSGRGGEADIAAAYVQLTLAKAYLTQGRAAEAAAAAAMAKGLLGDDPPPPPREQRL